LAPLPTASSTLSLHDALLIFASDVDRDLEAVRGRLGSERLPYRAPGRGEPAADQERVCGGWRYLLEVMGGDKGVDGPPSPMARTDRKSTRLNSSHQIKSYAGF